MRRAVTCVVLGVLLAVAGGCASTFHETHYFKSVDARGDPVNYYRVRVDGGTFLSSSRFVSGYFAEDAVDAYFSEVAQPDKAHFDGRVQPADAEARPLDRPGDDRKLVLILSSNSDEIAAGIGSLAQTDDITATLANIVARNRIREAGDRDAGQAAQAARARRVADVGDTLVTNLDPAAAPQGDVEQNMLRYANVLGDYLGNNRGFATLDEANAWLAGYRRR